MLEMVMIPVTTAQSVFSVYWTTVLGAFGTVPSVLLTAVAAIGTIWVLKFVITGLWNMFKSRKKTRTA